MKLLLILTTWLGAVYAMDAPLRKGQLVELTGAPFEIGATKFKTGMTGEILNTNAAGAAQIAFRSPDHMLGAQWILKEYLGHFGPIGSKPSPTPVEPSKPTPSEPSTPSRPDSDDCARTQAEQRTRIAELEKANKALEAELAKLRRDLEACRKSKPTCPATPSEPSKPSKPTEPAKPSKPSTPPQEDGTEANPPKWPSSVRIFGPEHTYGEIDQAVLAAYSQNGGRVPEDAHGHFSDARFAFLFKPGTYTNDIPVGYYTQICGLGENPSDVVFSGTKGVYCEEGSYLEKRGALDTFWRGAENFKTLANWQRGEGKGMLWAVSQASFLRRIEAAHDLTLYQYEPVGFPGGPIQYGAGFASGGYCADMRVGGSVNFGSQQQWFARNSNIHSAGPGGVWNMVYGGVEGAPASNFNNINGTPNTVLDRLPVTSSKPYITIRADGKFNLVIPAVQNDSRGPQETSNADRVVDFSNVYVTDPSDSAATINAKLAEGLHVVVTPGNYNLEEALELNTEGQVLMGLGLATLIPTKGNAAIRVGDVDGARIAGVMVQAGPADQNTEVLVEVGSGANAGTAAKPTFLHDLFIRVGGPNGGPADDAVSAKVMLRVNNGHVIGDNLWLWRADHTRSGLVRAQHSQCDHALQVNGEDVIMYGLAAEHTQKDQVQWNGERGSTYFYQCELPYEPADEDGAWTSGRSVGYRVADGVKDHDAWGMGIYSYFRDHLVTAHTAIACPQELAKRFHHTVTVKLNGYGSIANVINNDKGVPGKSDNRDVSVYGSGPVNYIE